MVRLFKKGDLVKIDESIGHGSDECAVVIERISVNEYMGLEDTAIIGELYNQIILYKVLFRGTITIVQSKQISSVINLCETKDKKKMYD